ncbi:MAG: 50S ribosomal protein L35ae [Candidatus Baldrarchaeia archaeon]
MSGAHTGASSEEFKVALRGVIVNYRRGRHTQKNTHVLIKVPGIDSSKEAARLIGRRVLWISESGKRIKGKIVDIHGNNGVVRARMEKGVPGQALGTEILIL